MRSSLAAGDTLKFTVTLTDYPASAGWVLSYRLAPRAAGSPIDFSATASGDDHQVNVAAATTASWTAGAYTAGAWVSRAGERYAIPSEGGQLTITLNPAALSGGVDTRSEAELALAAVTALITRKATSGDEEYRINGRQLKSYPLPDLVKLQQKLRNEVDAERAAAGLPPLYGGAGGPRRILVRMP